MRIGFIKMCNTVAARASSGQMSRGPPVFCALSRAAGRSGSASETSVADGAVRAPGHFVRKWLKECRDRGRGRSYKSGQESEGRVVWVTRQARQERVAESEPNKKKDSLF